MSDVFGIGVSGLRAFQRALSTTSHNVANAATEGYSRQRTLFETRSPEVTALGSLGTGVNVARVERVYDDFLTAQVRNTGSTQQQSETLSDLSARVDSLLATDEMGLSQPMQRYFDAVQDVANNPSSLAPREVLVAESESLADRFRALDRELSTVDSEVDARLGDSVIEVNALADEIADINQRIQTLPKAQRASANDLLDQRDEALRKLSEHVGTSAVMQDDGAMNVFIGSGQALVVGGQSSHLATAPSSFDESRVDIVFAAPNSQLDVTHTLDGGRIGGLLQFRNEVLDPAFNRIGRLAIAMSDQLNGQHRRGMDLNGAMGGDLFSPGGTYAAANASNTGLTTVQVSILDSTALTDSDYQVHFDGTDHHLIRLNDGSSQVLGAPGPFLVDGMEIVIDTGAGAPVAGDRFLLRPTRTAAAGFQSNIVDPRHFAAAAPVLAQANPANLGTAQITPGTVLDANDPALLDRVEIRFADPPVAFDVVDVTSGTPISAGVAYVDGGDIDVNGYRVQISGAPQAGDRFDIASNAGGTGDNRNFLALGATRQEGYLDGGATSFGEEYSGLVADVGSKTSAARHDTVAQTAMLDQAVAARESVAGVNLDEEAANLLRFQQAYQANAEIIRVADEMFRSILAAVGN